MMPALSHAARRWARRRLTSPALLVFLVTFGVYAALVPWMARAWQRSGDEPDYLVAAHSLAIDADLDLANNYAQRHYEGFYSEYYLNPHTVQRADGQSVLTHNLGLSLLIAPAYAAGGLHGVLYLLALLAALLSSNVYLLGYQLTGNAIAAAAGWAAVSFTPPVLWYSFLVYPEMVGGLCVLVALRNLLALEASVGVREYGGVGDRHGNGWGVAARVGLSLAVLPWLSSRFLPMWGVLGALALWRAYIARRADRGRQAAWLGAALVGGAGLAGYMLFSFWLYGSASPAASYAGPIPLAVERSFALLRVSRGLLGWLFDTQRGLLVSAPIYIAAAWGVLAMLRRKPMAAITILALFAAALLPVAVWGGFWTGWEYSARFLVVVLPALGAGVAYLWAAGRRAVVVPVTVLLFALSLSAGQAVMQQPLRGIISSPVEQLKRAVGLDLAPVVPAMARYAFIPAGTGAAVGSELPPDVAGTLALVAAPATSGAPVGPGALTWQVPAGQSGIVIRQVDLPEFPFGWYRARLPLAAPGAEPDTPVARIRIFSPSGGEYYSQTIYGRDLAQNGSGAFEFGFHSPLYNGWGFPPTFLVSATGQSELQLGMLSIEPDRFRSLGLAAAWLSGLALLGLLVAAGASQPRPWRFAPPAAVNLGLALIALGVLGWSLRPQPRTYAAVDVQRTTGLVVADPLAYRGQAMEADPLAGQEPGRLAYTHPEIYEPGRYRLSASLFPLAADASTADPAAVIAALRVLGSDANAFAMQWEITAASLPAEGPSGAGYQLISFEFDNPRQQALTFFLDYTGAAGLRGDRILVEPIR